jgi:hypothetical protein
MALSSMYPTCGTQGGVLSRAGQWVATHPPWPAIVRAGSPNVDCRRRVCTPCLCFGEDTLAGRRGGGGSIFWKTRDRGLPSYSTTLSTPGGFQRGQDVHNPGGPKPGARLLESSEFPHRPWPSISCKGRPLRPTSQEARRSHNPACAFLKPQN